MKYLKTKQNFLFVIALAFIFATGCQYIKTSGGVTPDIKAEPSKSLVKDEDFLQKEEAVGIVESILKSADKLAGAENLPEAQREYQTAVEILLTRVDRAKKSEWDAKLEQLFLRACLQSLRVARLRGVMLTAPEDETTLGIQYNPRVEYWMKYYLTNGRMAMQKALIRSGAYMDMIERVLAEKGQPDDLKYLPIIESEFYPYALSPASAVGIWQFIPGTARRFGMRIDAWVDERRDPEIATNAAAQYLSENYAMLGDWSLALAGYNCGEDRVARNVRTKGVKDFWQLDLPQETMNYVPKFYAAMLIAKQPELYGFFVEPNPAMRPVRIPLDGVASLKTLAGLAGMDYDELKAFNPALLGDYTPPKDIAYTINVPENRAEVFQKMLEEFPREDLYLTKTEIRKLTAPKKKYSYIRYKVKKGDSLWNIARKYKTTVKCLKRLNPKIRRNIIRPGWKIKVKRGCKR
jgi:LysM repeat protein